MKIDYLGYLIEPSSSYSEASGRWVGTVTIMRDAGDRSLPFEARGSYSTEASAVTAALMLAQHLILEHKRLRSKAMRGLDADETAGIFTKPESPPVARVVAVSIAAALKPPDKS